MFVEEVTAQPAEFVGAEPGLGFEPEGVERAVVADEERGFLKVSHGWPPWSFEHGTGETHVRKACNYRI
ncbi:hypothetical protein METHP14_920027 [Pseudomonas sp. P14-2025]